MSDSMTVLSGNELDEVSGGGGSAVFQFALFNTAAGVQVAPTLNVSGLAFFTAQHGATQVQLVNAGNIAAVH